jgi:hypothetical protein
MRIPDWKFWSSLALVSVVLGALIVSTMISGALAGRSQDTNSQFLASNAKSSFTFRDEFSYPSIDKLVAAGWTLCGGGPTSHYSVHNSVLTLQNDGVAGAGVCWSNIAAGVTSWTGTARGKWASGYYGSIEQIMQTKSHVYRWDADGYYSQFILLRDDVIVFRANGYTPLLDSWHVLRMSMVQGNISLFFDGSLIGHFNEPDPIVPLSTIALIAGWESTTSWDYVTASSL